MTTDQHILKLEEEIGTKFKGVDHELSTIKQSVNIILELVKKMDAGIYGDDKNKYTGVIDRQTLLEQEINKLKQQIEEIHKKNRDQDLQINTKKTFKGEIWEWIKKLAQFILQGIILYLIFKGTLAPDALLNVK